jgi:dCMP deaminase
LKSIHDYESIGIFSDNRFVAKNERLSWDEYFLNIAFLVAERSHDSQTKHGCVFVKNNQIISTGYNGFPGGSPDDIIPNVRPYKYDFIHHAEDNAIFQAAKLGLTLDGCVAYITGMPCCRCLPKLISVGIKKIHIGDRIHQQTEKDKLLQDFWISQFKLEIIKNGINR